MHGIVFKKIQVKRLPESRNNDIYSNNKKFTKIG